MNNWRQVKLPQFSWGNATPANRLISLVSFTQLCTDVRTINFWTMLTLRTCRSILQVWVKIEILKPVTSQELLHFVVTYNQIWRLQKQAWFDKWSDYLKPVPQIRKVVLMFNLIIALKVSYPSVTQLLQDSNFWKLPKIINNFQAKDCKR